MCWWTTGSSAGRVGLPATRASNWSQFRSKLGTTRASPDWIQRVNGQVVGRVQTEVSDQGGGRQPGAEVRQPGQVADQHPVRAGPDDDRLEPLLARLPDPRRGQPDRHSGGNARPGARRRRTGARPRSRRTPRPAARTPAGGCQRQDGGELVRGRAPAPSAAAPTSGGGRSAGRPATRPGRRPSASPGGGGVVLGRPERGRGLGQAAARRRRSFSTAFGSITPAGTRQVNSASSNGVSPSRPSGPRASAAVVG